MPIHDTTIAFYIIALLVLVAFHFLLRFLLKPRLRFKPAPQGPRCQNCGYILFGGINTICPECGDGRIGQLTLQCKPPPTPPIALVLGICLLLFPLTIGAAYPIFKKHPQVWRGEALFTVDAPPGNVLIWAAADGRGSARKIAGNEVLFPGATQQQRFHLNLHSMRLEPRRGPTIPATRAGILGLFGVGDVKLASPPVLSAADEVVAELESLHDNRWLEDRFHYEMKGHYAIDPDDDWGPFFWVPNYTPICIPVWLVLSFFSTRRICRRYRSAVDKYELGLCARAENAAEKAT